MFRYAERDLDMAFLSLRPSISSSVQCRYCVETVVCRQTGIAMVILVFGA